MYGELIIQSVPPQLVATPPLWHWLWVWDTAFSNDQTSVPAGLFLDGVTPGQYGKGKRFLACQVPRPELSC